jgi:hypothetical protein
MTLPDPLEQRAFVPADGTLAEFMCRVHLLELTPERARQRHRTIRDRWAGSSRAD